MVSALYEGTFSVGLDKKFIRIDRNNSPNKGALKLSINPFLIRYGERVMLFDTGLGEFGEDTSLETITAHLETYQLTPFDITDVFLSHLHYDHLGGLAGTKNGYLELTFPEAKLWANKKEWEKMKRLNGATDNEARREFFYFIDARADIQMIEGRSEPYPEIKIEEVGGHTEFSQVLYFETDQNRYMMAGDIIGRKVAVQQKFTAKFDFNPERSLEVREELKKRACEENYIIMAYHESHTPLFRITEYDSKKGYVTEAVENASP